MPEFPTLAAVDLGSNSFGSDITCAAGMLVCTGRMFANSTQESYA